MNKVTKVLFIIYSFIFVALIGFLIYINFFDSKIDFISNRHLVALIFAFLLGIAKVLTKNQNKHNLNFYKKVYSHIIKDSFSENKKQLTQLLKAVKFYNDNKFSKALELLSDLERKCNTNSEKYSVYLFEALIHSDSENDDEAIEIYENMINHGIADSRVFSNLLNIYKEKGDFEKAYDAGIQAIHTDPKNCNAYNNFAYFLFSDGNYEEAEEYAKKALEIKNNFVESITLLYLIYTIEGRSKEAETFERKAVSNGRSKKELEEILEYYIGESKR